MLRVSTPRFHPVTILDKERVPMEQTKQPVPREAIDAYNKYIHGEIDRRAFMDRVKKVAVSTAAAAAIVDQLMPNYAAAQQVSPSDSRIKTERAEVPSPNGNGSIKGYLVRPANAGNRKLPAILVVHENRGLNPHIEDVARRFALEGFMAFAPDGLTSVGGYPGDDGKGGELFGKVDRNKMAEDLYAAAVWVKNRPDSTGKLGVTGFCFGGGVANSLAVRMGADLAAAVPYYGGAPPAADVPKIKAAVLIHHGGEDKRLVDAYPAYADALKAAGVTYEGHIYPGAVHGFNNDATPERYNKAAATEAWGRTVAWFKKYVGNPTS
jgi:carboxymethylenebutenolidase